jgi:hypothetical protein
MVRASLTEARDRLSAALAAVPLMQVSQGDLLRLLRDRGVDVPVPQPGPIGLQCSVILSAILDRRGALRALAQLLGILDGSVPANRFCDLVNEMLPESFLTLPEKHELIDLLDRSCPGDRLGLYYAQAAGRDPDTALRDAGDFINRLGQEPEDPDLLAPLIQALEVIADDLPATEAGAYREHADEIAIRIDADRPPGGDARPQFEQLRARRQAGAGPAKAVAESPYIILRVDPSDVRPREQFELSCLLYYGDRLVKKLYTGDRLTLAEVRAKTVALISEALEMAEQRLGTSFRPMVEFILPRDQINLAVEGWHGEVPYLSLATQFAVVVRDLSRQQDASKRHACRQKWRHAEEKLRSNGLAVSWWITCSDEPHGPGALYLSLLADTMTAVGLTFPPDGEAHHFQVDELLDAGIPVALWPHACDHGSPPGAAQASKTYAEFRDKLTKLLAQKPMSELPHIVHELRRSIPGMSEPDGGVALLWDDPDRVVQPSKYRLAAPHRAGAAR